MRAYYHDSLEETQEPLHHPAGADWRENVKAGPPTERPPGADNVLKGWPPGAVWREPKADGAPNCCVMMDATTDRESIASVCAGWVIDDLNKLDANARERILAAMKERSTFCWSCGANFDESRICHCENDE